MPARTTPAQPDVATCPLCSTVITGSTCTKCGFSGPLDTPETSRLVAKNPRWWMEGPDNMLDHAASLERQRDAALALAQFVLFEVNGLNATERATRSGYSASPLHAAVTQAVKLASEIIAATKELD